MSRPSQRDVGDFMGEIFAREQQQREDEASGWLVAVTDLEDPTHLVSAYGPFDSPEAALIAAGEMDACPHTGAHPVDGETGWRHEVVPLFAYVEPKRD